MKRLFLALAFLSVCAGLFATDAADPAAEPVPYSPDEFPQWAKDLRRAEIIMIGSIPVTVLLSGFLYTLYRWYDNDFISDYAPGIFGSQAARELNRDEKLGVLTVTVSLSGAIALADYIVGKVRPAEE